MIDYLSEAATFVSVAYYTLDKLLHLGIKNKYIPKILIINQNRVLSSFFRNFE